MVRLSLELENANRVLVVNGLEVVLTALAYIQMTSAAKHVGYNVHNHY